MTALQSSVPVHWYGDNIETRPININRNTVKIAPSQPYGGSKKAVIFAQNRVKENQSDYQHKNKESYV